jgi:hypothetical protein
MAAARQKEMNDNITVVATTTLTVAGRFPGVTEGESPNWSLTLSCSAHHISIG